MPSLDPGPELFIRYWSSFRRHAHQIIMWGYQDAERKIKSKNLEKYWKEEEITGFITAAIQDRLRASDCPRWCSHFSVKEENPVPSINLAGKKRKRTDIIIEYTKNRRPEYIFESKRLLKNKCKEDAYILKGLLRFVDGQYASRYPEAGMIGYVQSDSLDYWMGKIQIAIEAEPSSSYNLNPVNSQKPLMPSDTYSLGWSSQHKRKYQGEIVIYHILLDSIPKEN
jgi:hypothetical protein